MLRLADFTSDIGMKRLELIKEAVPHTAGSPSQRQLLVQLSAGRRLTLLRADELIQ